jgi:hypothetical protein
MSMVNTSNNRIAAIIEDIYQIDPELVEFEADLSRLITDIDAHRPVVTIHQKFVSELRTSLLSYKPAPVITKPNNAHPISWWFIRLVPVGISMILFVVLVPDLRTTPSQTPDAADFEMFESTPDLQDTVDTEMRMDTMMLESDEAGDADDTSMLYMESSATSLAVAPPLAGNSLTVTSVIMPDSGWIAIYSDEGGELGELLGSLLLPKGEQNEVKVMLAETLSYPGMVTVVVYTGSNTNKFDAAIEYVQIDPLNNSPMMVTVPVISQFELDVME